MFGVLVSLKVHQVSESCRLISHGFTAAAASPPAQRSVGLSSNELMDLLTHETIHRSEVEAEISEMIVRLC